MLSRDAMTRTSATWIAAALLAAALACSSSGNDGPSGTCSPAASPPTDPTAAHDYCLAMYGAVCDRGFGDCAAQIGLNQIFATVEECRSALTAQCTQDFSGYGYDAPCAAACVDVIQHGACSIFLAASEPQACASALRMPLPACTATITAGTISDTITVADPLYDGSHARTYCITLAANRIVTVETLPPTSGSEIFDTVVYLLDPLGVQIGFDDDGGTGLYSLLTRTVTSAGEYRIVVAGYSSSNVGSYQLRVTVN